MRSGLLRRLGNDWLVQLSADDLCKLAKRHALLGHRVISGAGGTVLQRELNDPRGIDPVHGRPTVPCVADVGGNALLAGNADQLRHESMITLAMD